MLSKKLTTAITTFTAVATLVMAGAPAALANQAVITGNGAVSQNQADITSNNATTAVQNNNANISNTVNSEADSGHNNASFNTGGSVAIVSGGASNSTSVENMVNS